MTDSFQQILPVLSARDVTVVRGANQGDAMSFADELDLDDVYELGANARPSPLAVQPGDAGTLRIAPGSSLGTPGNYVHLDAALTLMSASGSTAELLVMVEVDARSHVEAVHILPLAQMQKRCEYTLVGVDRAAAQGRFAGVACVSFSRGTLVTLSSGAQRPIEDLRPADLVLTRDDGPRPLRWIGSATSRAEGDFAPILIRAGTLNNSGDLRVSPESRLFIYQRSDALGAGRREVMVRARHLVNGSSIVQERGGFIDYFHLLFDQHQIIYVEGIAAETMLVDPRTRAVLPSDLEKEIAGAAGTTPSDAAYQALDASLAGVLPGHDHQVRSDLELRAQLLDRPDLADLLRRASTR